MENMFLRGVAALGLAALGACADVNPPTDPLAAAKLTAAQRLANESATARVARGIALAMNRDDLRYGLAAAMHDSPYTEHKLILQEFIATDLGQAVVTEAAASLGESPARLQQEISRLPQLDFYLPIRAQREAWQGSPDIAVVAYYKTAKATVDLNLPDGSVVTWLKSGGGVPAMAVVVLSPAERRVLRLVKVRKPGGAMMDCDPEAITCDGGDTGGGGEPVHGVYIDHFNPQDDDGLFGGDVELRFTFTFETDGQVVVINRTQEPFVGSDENILVSTRACDASNNPPHFTLHLEEDDGGFNGGDDEMGTYHWPDRQYNVTEDLWDDGDRKMWLRMTCL